MNTIAPAVPLKLVLLTLIGGCSRPITPDDGAVQTAATPHVPVNGIAPEAPIEARSPVAELTAEVEVVVLDRDDLAPIASETTGGAPPIEA